MRALKMIGLAAMAAVAMTALVGAGSASATTLEISSVTQNQAVTLEASFEAGTDTVFETTTGIKLNTCTASELIVGIESPYTAAAIGGKVSTLNFTCLPNPVSVVSSGTLTIEWIKALGWTDGTVFLSGAEWGMEWGSGAVETCKVATGTPFGVLRGVASGHARLYVNTVAKCDVWSSVRMTGTYIITSPTGLGVSA